MRGRSVGRYLKRHWLAAALIVLVVLSEALILAQFPVDGPDISKAPQYSGQTQQASRPIPPLSAAWVPIRARLLHALDINLSFIDRYHDDLNAISTLAVAIFTATLWGTTRGLYVSGEKQIKIANRNAAAAERAADTAKDTLIASYRPWVKINELQFHGRLFVSSENSVQARVTVNFENIGNAPAECYISSWLIIEKGIDKVIAEHIAYADHHRMNLRGIPFVVYPKDVFPPIGDFDFLYFTTIANFGNNTTTAMIDSGNFWHLYIGACITYRVAGSAARPHQTRILKGLLASTSLRSTETDKWNFHIRHRFDPGGHAAD